MDQKVSDAQLHSSSFLTSRVGLVWIAALLFQFFLIVQEVDVVGWFWQDQKLDVGREKAGQFLKKKNDVRYQWSNDLVWNSASEESQIFYDQSILTLQESSALVRLDSGIELELPERSMISVRRPTRIDDDLVTLLTLGRGRINVRKIPNKIQVRLPKNQGQITLTKGSSADISLVKPEGAKNSDDFRVRLHLREGEASIQRQNAKEEVKKGQYLLEVKKDRIQVEKKIPAPPKPEIDKPVELKPKVQTKPKVRAPKVPKVKKPVKPKPPRRPDAPSEFNDPKFKTSITLPPTTIIITLLKWIVPTAIADENSKGIPVELSWEEVPDAADYEIQVARTRAFSNLLGEGKTNINRWEWIYHRGVENTKGRVFYRVRSISKGGIVGKYSDPVPLPIPDEIRFPPKPVVEVPTPKPIEPKPQSQWVEQKVEKQKWEASVGWGYYAFKSTQKSSSGGLNTASLQFPSQAQAIDIDVRRILTGLSYRLNLQASLLNLQGRDSIANTQPEIKTYDANIRVLAIKPSRFWIWDQLGIGARRSFRFEKVSSAEVSAPGGWSFGVSAERRFLVSSVAGVNIDLLPVGLFMNGPGVFQVQSDIQLFHFKIGEVQFSGGPEFGYRFEYWKEPTRTRIHTASVGLSIAGKI